MNKLKNSFLLTFKNKKFFNKNINNFNILNSNPILFTTNKFFFSENYDSKIKNFSSKKINKENFLNGNNYDNLTKIRRHEMKSHLNSNSYDKIKINPSDEAFYGK